MKRILALSLAAFPSLLALLGLLGCQSTAGGEVENSFVEARDGKLLAYRKIGTGESVLVVPEGSWVMDDMTRLIRGRTVIFYDPRGRGLSDPALSFRFEQDLADLEAVVEWFQLERFSMLGTHLGATLSAMYAAKHPEKVERLVLVSPPPIRRDPYWAIYQRVFNDRRSVAAFEHLAELKRELVPKHDPALWAKAYKEAFFSGWVVKPASVDAMKSTPFPPPNDDPELQIQKYLGMIRALGEWNWAPLLEQIDAPTLVVYGDKDPVPQRSFVEWVNDAGARVELVEDAGRLPWIEQPGRFYGQVEAFLAGE